LSLANSLQYLAFILLDKNKIDEALLLQYRVIALFLRHQQLPEISDSFYLLSSILQYAGLYDEAEKSLAVSLNFIAIRIGICDALSHLPL
jgi:tetratricopeptide (TPR) repeat protein